MRSVFERFQRQPNIMEDVQRLKNNPSQIGEMLLNTGRINREQYEQIKQMNNPKDICIYLMGQNEQFKQAVQMMRTLQS